MLPPLSSMHLVNCCVAPAQLLPQAGLLWEALLAWRLEFCASPGRGSLLLPPLKRPVTAWPMVEPIATPLVTLVSFSRTGVGAESMWRRKGLRGCASNVSEHTAAHRGCRRLGLGRRVRGRGRSGGVRGGPGLLLVGRVGGSPGRNGGTSRGSAG